LRKDSRLWTGLVQGFSPGLLNIAVQTNVFSWLDVGLGILADWTVSGHGTSPCGLQLGQGLFSRLTANRSGTGSSEWLLYAFIAESSGITTSTQRRSWHSLHFTILWHINIPAPQIHRSSNQTRHLYRASRSGRLAPRRPWLCCRKSRSSGRRPDRALNRRACRSRSRR